MFSKTFYLKRWVDEETFHKLLTFSRFIGRSGNISQFVLDVERARRNRVRLNEIIDILSKLGVEFSNDELSGLSKLLPEYDVEFIVKNNKLWIVPYVYVMDIIKDLDVEIKYDRNNKIFISYPFYYYILKQAFVENGLRVKELEINFKSFEFKLDVDLRDYQKEALVKWKENNFKGVIALPTGAGKTIIGIQAVQEVKVPTLIVTFTREQLLQWKDQIVKSSSIRPEIGLYYSSKKEIRPITITTYQTAFRHINELAWKFDLLIIDEVHHLPAEKFRQIALGMIASKRLGLSATPYREDGKHIELFKLMGGVVYYKPVNELINKGYLAPYDVVQVKVFLTREERKKYVELLNKYRVYAYNRTLKELLELAKNGDTRAIEAIKIYNELKKIVNLASNKMAKLGEIIDKEKGKKILIFTQYIEQAEQIAQKFNALLVSGKINKTERKMIIEKFKRMASGILVLTTVGDEGLDIPDASVGIIVTGTGSRRQFVQRLGRLLRPAGNKRAMLYEIVVAGTQEEYQSRKRKSTDDLLEVLQISSEYSDDI